MKLCDVITAQPSTTVSLLLSESPVKGNMLSGGKVEYVIGKQFAHCIGLEIQECHYGIQPFAYTGPVPIAFDIKDNIPFSKTNEPNL
jgi:hypothetical protein